MKGTAILLNHDTLDLRCEVERDGAGLIARGLVVGTATYQNQALILQAAKGEYKEHPTLGADISSMLADDDVQGWKREVALQLEADGMRVERVEITADKLTIDADYGR